MNPVSAVIFDMDGLIFDTERICYQIYLEAARTFGFQMTRNMYTCLCGRTEKGILDDLSRAYGPEHDVASWRAFVRERKAPARAALNGRVGKKPGLLELLSYLAEREIPYAMASSSTRDVIDSCLAGEYLTHAFPVIMDGSMVEHGKPDPEIFLRAADALGVAPEDTLVLEDSRAGIRAANAGGFMSGFVYDDMSDLPEVHEGFPILVELEGPEAIAAEARFTFDTLADAVPFIEGARTRTDR